MILKFQTMAEFKAFSAQMDALLGYPAPGGFQTYTEGTEHPKDGTVICVVDARCPAALSDPVAKLDVPRLDYYRNPEFNPKYSPSDAAADAAAIKAKDAVKLDAAVAASAEEIKP